jgi:hypothetical protein
VFLIQVVVAFVLTAELVAAQDVPSQPASPNGQSTASATVAFVLGAGTALAAHEGGHLLFDEIFDAHPSIQKVSFHGIPFFAVTHDYGRSDRKEYVIDTAGFWVQEATNEWLLHRHPDLRHEKEPYLKGVFAFNVLASVAYAGAAFAQTGPVQRDTRGMAQALHWKEPAVGVLVLLPAVFDAVRYYHPGAAWAVWGARTSKLAGVVLVFK